MERKLVIDMLQRMIGKRVRINICLNETASDFSTNIAVVGILEGSIDTGNFRVLSNEENIDDSSYSYFTIDDIACAADRSKSTTKQMFRCGALAAFYLGGRPVHPYSDLDMPTIIKNENSDPMIVVT